MVVLLTWRKVHCVLKERKSMDKESVMKLLRIFSVIPLWVLMFSSEALAGDFDWIRGFNIQVEADPSGFRARLEARFQIGDVAIQTVLSNCENPSDAYILLRMGEISGKPIGYVTHQYNTGNGKGWGSLAKSLGIKPGSGEFHALKKGQDLYVIDNFSRAKGKGKGKLKHTGKK